MFQKNKIYLAALFFIFILAFFLRFYRLSEFPVGFQIDEASLGYNGYSLLQTGKDDNNDPRPLYIDVFGDNRPSGYHFLTVPSIAFFGLNEFATRTPGAFFGSLSIFAFYFLTYVLFKNKTISLLCCLLLAVAPWQVVLSRASAEAVVSLFFIMIGFSFVILGLETKKMRYLFISIPLLGLSFLFYHTSRIFVPLLFLAIILLVAKTILQTKNNEFRNALIASFLIISFISFSLIFLIPGGTGRYGQVNIFTHPGTALVMQEQIREDGVSSVPPAVVRVFHNKITNYFETFAKNYLDYFSGNFLFISGGLPVWYVVPNMGLFYLIELPFMLLGLFLLLKKNDISGRIVLVWLLIAPVTAAVTIDDVPNINRDIVMFPILTMLGGYGLYYFFKQKILGKKAFFIIVLLFFVYNFSYFMHQYYVHSKVHRTWYRSNGFKDLMSYIKTSYNDYDKIVFSKGGGGVYPLVLFYMRYNPSTYQKEGSPKDREYSGFGKFVFVPQDCPSFENDSRIPKDKRILFVNQGFCKETKLVKYIKNVYREDGTRGFRLQRFIPKK